MESLCTEPVLIFSWRISAAMLVLSLSIDVRPSQSVNTGIYLYVYRYQSMNFYPYIQYQVPGTKVYVLYGYEMRPQVRSLTTPKNRFIEKLSKRKTRCWPLQRQGCATWVQQMAGWLANSKKID